MKKLPHASRRATFLSFIAAALAAAALAACSSGSSGEPSKDVGAASPSGARTAAAAATSAAPGGAATQAPAAPAAAGPNGRSTVPTQDEWTAAKEVGVKNSSKLNCETKMVREWLRISCKGKNDTGGEPKAVTMTKGGGRGDTFTFASNKVASLVCPYVDGVDIAAQFEWTDKKMELVVSWPHGAPMPTMMGEFR
jgi:hypothetical protein